MGVTSSGLLDEERDEATGTGSATEIDAVDSTLEESGELNAEATDIIGRDVAGTPRVNFRGPCIYTLP